MSSLILLSSLCAAIACGLAILFIDDIWLKLADRYVSDLQPRLDELGIDHSQLPTWLRWWGIALLGSLMLGLYAPPVAIVLTYFVWIAPRNWLNYLIWERKRQLRDQMVGATTGIANAARAGLALPQCFQAIAAETPEPLKSELDRVYRDYSNGMVFTDVITSVKNRLKIDSFALFAPAILTAWEHGGSIPDALERISRTLQEVQRLERKVDADTAASRKSVWLLSIFPLFFLILFIFLFPDGTIGVFTTWLGQTILAIVGVMTYVAVRWSLRILAIDF